MDAIDIQNIEYIFKLYILPYLPILIKIVLAVVFPVVLMSSVALMAWVERRGSAMIQDRLGPNRSNVFGFTFWGLLHSLNDGIKFITKETFVPAKARLFFYFMAPAIVLVPALLTFAVIPVAAPAVIFGVTVPFQIAEIDTGILYTFAISSLGVYGLVIAGWSSGNKFSLLGGVRSASQMLSYEVVLGISLVTVFMIFSEIEPYKIVEMQGELLFGFIPKWGILLSPVAFILFLIASYAETNRTPFDLPEGDSEIVAGYHLEYGGMKFAMFMMSEYVAMATMSAIIVTMFFGGYQVPFFNTARLNAIFHPLVTAPLQIAAFTVKAAFFMWLYVWVRWTLPRFRYDQIMKLCYINMFPIAVANIFVTGVVILLLDHCF